MPEPAAVETHHRCEGWPVGLRLSTLASASAASSNAHESALFLGNGRHVDEYLFSEVLANQPEPIRRFLLQSSVLNGSAGRSAKLWWTDLRPVAADAYWLRWSVAGCSSRRSTTTASGTAATTSFATCCGGVWSLISRLTRCWRSMRGRVRGLRRKASPRRRSTTRCRRTIRIAPWARGGAGARLAGTAAMGRS